jgi:hypothetical protein
MAEFAEALDFNPQFLDVQGLFHSNRRDEAIRLAQKHLRDGYSSPPFLKLVADLLDPPPAGRGRGRPKQWPRRWLEIGQEFCDLRECGIKYDDALAQLADREHASEETIRRTIKFYNKALERFDAIDEEEY